MNLYKDQPVYEMPPHSYIQGVIVMIGGDRRTNPGAYAMVVSEVSQEEIRRRQNDKHSAAVQKGYPKICCFHQSQGQIEFWPTPDKDYEVKIRYAPPLVEI